MVTWFNTPFEDVIKATTNLYGDLNCKVGFNPCLHLEEEAYGATTWGEDGSIVIELDGETPMMHLVETLAHELAHVVVGPQEEHNWKWECAFDCIYNEYNKICTEKYKVNTFKTKCFDCGAKEILEYGMEGKKCSKCKGRLIPY